MALRVWWDQLHWVLELTLAGELPGCLHAREDWPVQGQVESVSMGPSASCTWHGGGAALLALDSLSSTGADNIDVTTCIVGKCF